MEQLDCQLGEVQTNIAMHGKNKLMLLGLLVAPVITWLQGAINTSILSVLSREDGYWDSNILFHHFLLMISSVDHLAWLDHYYHCRLKKMKWWACFLVDFYPYMFIKTQNKCWRWQSLSCASNWYYFQQEILRLSKHHE